MGLWGFLGGDWWIWVRNTCVVGVGSVLFIVGWWEWCPPIIAADFSPDSPGSTATTAGHVNPPPPPFQHNPAREPNNNSTKPSTNPASLAIISVSI